MCVVALQIHVVSARAAPESVVLYPLGIVCVLAAVPLVVPSRDSFLCSVPSVFSGINFCFVVCCLFLSSSGAYPGQGG